MYISPLSWASVSPLEVNTEQARLPVLTAAPHQLPISHVAVRVRQCHSQFIPTSPSPDCVHTFILSVYVSIPALQIGSSVPLFFPRFHIYVLMYDIHLSLADLLHSEWQTLSPSTSLQMTQSCSFFSWVIFHRKVI